MHIHAAVEEIELAKVDFVIDDKGNKVPFKFLKSS